MGRHAARSNCPFCGWYASDIMPKAHKRAGCFRLFARCCACGARGPEAETIAEASEQWDKRAEFLDRHGKPAPRVPLDFGEASHEI
jgi:hypothetical protein